MMPDVAVPQQSQFMVELMALLHSAALAVPALLIVLMIATATAAFVFAVVLLVFRPIRAELGLLAAIFLCLALIGAAAGYAGGMSRSAAVGNVIPAVLSLIGGVVLYVFGVANRQTVVPPLGAIVLVAALVMGYSTGSNFRGKIEAQSSTAADQNLTAARLCRSVARDLADVVATADRSEETQPIADRIRTVLSERCAL
jgi:hypothetical protein